MSLRQIWPDNMLLKEIIMKKTVQKQASSQIITELTKRINQKNYRWQTPLDGRKAWTKSRECLKDNVTRPENFKTNMNYKAPRSQDIDAKGSTQEARIQAVKGIKGSGGSPENGRIKLGTQDRFYLGL